MLFSHFWRWEISISLEGTLGEKMGPIHQVSLPFSGGGFLMQDPFNVEALFLLDQSDTYWMLTTATFAQRCWVFANATRPKIDRVTKNPHSWPSFWGSHVCFPECRCWFFMICLISFEYQVMYCGCTLACIQALSICLSGRYSCYTVDCVDILVAFFTQHNSLVSRQIVSWISGSDGLFEKNHLLSGGVRLTRHLDVPGS